MDMRGTERLPNGDKEGAAGMDNATLLGSPLEAQRLPMPQQSPLDCALQGSGNTCMGKFEHVTT
jgi:hypothetical protein